MTKKHLMRGDGMDRKPPIDMSDRLLWRRSSMTELVEDEADRYLDLAGFADELLDPDGSERVAAHLAHDPDALADVGAARALAKPTRHEPLSEAVLAAACALVPTSGHIGGEVIAFAPPRRTRPGLQTIAQWSAQWGSLAAAIAVAGWLGFTLGMDTLGDLAQISQSGDDGLFNELVDPAGGIMRDLTEGPQT